MANVVLINTQTHKELRVKPEFLLHPNDGLGSVQAFATELDALHKEFPVFIRKNTTTGALFLSALVSLQSDQNDFYQNNRWVSHYIPLLARRGPFLMAQPKENNVSLCIDLDDPRVNADGQRLFEEDGTMSPLCSHFVSVLQEVHRGHAETEAFITAMLEHKLIETIQFNDAATQAYRAQLTGLYAINAEKLKALPTKAAFSLNQAGHLQSAYFLASSNANVLKLLRHQQMKQAAAG